MIDSLRSRILDKGFVILSSKPTAVKEHPDAKECCLDLMLTNRQEKIMNFEAGLLTFSNHFVQSLSRSSKGIKKNQNYKRMRSFKNFNQKKFKEDILNHVDYIECMYEKDTDVITEKIQRVIKESLDPMAPIRIVQLSEKNAVELSAEVKVKITEKEVAQATYKTRNKIEDLR